MKTSKIQAGFSILLILLFFSIPFHPFEVLSSDFRCGTDIVSVGDSREEVRHACGEPDSVEIWDEERIKRDFFQPFERDLSEAERARVPFLVREHVRVEEWTYNPGPTSFMRYLRFENGRLTRIRTGDYGY